MSSGGDLSRRDFLALCGVMAASFASCTTVSSRTRLAAAFLADPPLDDYRRVLEGLIEAVLPTANDFPLSQEVVLSRLLSMFPIEEETRFLGLQKTLVFFNELELFPHTSGPLLAQERIALDVPERLDERTFFRLARENVKLDEQRTGRFLQDVHETAFTDLSLTQKRAYLDLWKESGFTIKREFAQGVRNMILVAAYADDRTWPAIAYDGTTKKRPEYQKVRDAKY